MSQIEQLAQQIVHRIGYTGCTCQLTGLAGGAIPVWQFWLGFAEYGAYDLRMTLPSARPQWRTVLWVQWWIHKLCAKVEQIEDQDYTPVPCRCGDKLSLLPLGGQATARHTREYKREGHD